MLDILPPPVFEAIRSSYMHGVANAEQGYIYSQEDEDVVTGSLGQSLLAEDQSVFDDGVVYIWRTTYQKFRGRGKNATEKRLGADGIFQIEVRNGDRTVLLRKALLFQAKNQWRGKDARLVKQASMLTFPPGVGVVIDYTAQGFFAVDARIVHQAEGDRKRLDSDALIPLSTMLGSIFLECKIGVTGMYYDPHAKHLHFSSNVVSPMSQAYRHLLTTTVVRVPLPSTS